MRPIALLQSTMPTVPGIRAQKKVNDFLTRPREKAEAPKCRCSPGWPVCRRAIPKFSSADDQSDISKILSGEMRSRPRFMSGVVRGQGRDLSSPSALMERATTGAGRGEKASALWDKNVGRSCR